MIGVIGASHPDRRRVVRVAVLSGMALVILLPLLPLVLQSVAGRWLYPDLLPESLSLRAWRYVADPRSRVLEATATSLLVAVLVTGVCVLLGVPAGRRLSTLRGRGRWALDSLFFAPLIVPGLVTALGLHVAAIRLGVSDTVGGVVVAHLLPTLPYMVLVMTATFTNVGTELEAQARTLGAGPVRAFLLVGVPGAVSGIVTGSFLVFLISWSQYALTLLIGGGRVVTIPVLLFAFAGAGDQAMTSALAVVFVLPAVAVLIATARHLTGRPAALTGMAGR